LHCIGISGSSPADFTIKISSFSRIRTGIKAKVEGKEIALRAIVVPVEDWKLDFLIQIGIVANNPSSVVSSEDENFLFREEKFDRNSIYFNAAGQKIVPQFG
jgi:hypothetical protein